MLRFTLRAPTFTRALPLLKKYPVSTHRSCRTPKPTMFHKQVSRLYSTGSVQLLAKILSTLLLLRPPVITADLPKFESQYYNYQKELWKRLMWTFPKWFYFREGTLAEQRFRELNKNPVHNNPNMEFIGGRPIIKHQRDLRFKQVLRLPKPYLEGEEGEVEGLESDKPVVPNSRTTPADASNDTTSLERKLARTLYLVISEDQGKLWAFPNFSCENTPLHKVAEEGLYGLGGTEINYFNVSPTPCHVQTSDKGKEFFIKLRILSGSFVAQNKNTTFKWLTSEELGEHLSKNYYEDIKHLMSAV
ncbi:hypothetical protein PUMCH_002450 [Australozyma saopauloensis]|uniref:Large ribosomal subunit protein mL46 n=1 Tax=Australozyma saopauloensis TaxID=291208 RepID=A0AAX4H9L4_9ASCO|nr:hypothetical protein PUMCH_002450 [[Candida] saopauloensis]